MNQAIVKKGGPVKEATHVRCGAKITRLGSKTVAKEETMYSSINLAKKASRKLQMEADRALGLGTVRVKEHKKKQKVRKRKSAKEKYEEDKKTMEKHMKRRNIVYKGSRRRQREEEETV